MPWTQDHLLPLLELLPTIIEPEDEVPNFHRLRLRMALIERQHVVLCLQAWVEDNESWLSQQGLTLQSGRNAGHTGDDSLTFYESLTEDRSHQGPHKAYRNTQVDALVDLLDLHATPIHQAFTEILVEDLNHIRWDPARVRQLLAFKIADAVPDSYVWLGRHSATRQAKLLSQGTRPLPPGSGKPRL